MVANRIIVADDDQDDQLLLKKAFKESGFEVNLKFVDDGEDLMSCLSLKEENTSCDVPCLIFLDLNMPRKDGRQALKEIKEDPGLKKIPVVIFTTSKSNEDIKQTYDLGANCFITKPKSFPELLKVIKRITEFWLETATLPCISGV